MEQIINIEGMSCGHCVSAVEKLVKEFPDASNIIVSLSDKKLTTTTNSTSREEIIAKINSSEIYKAS